MVFTVFNDLLELVLDLGSTGFYSAVYFSGVCMMSVDTDFFDFALIIIAIWLLKGEKWKSIIRFIRSLSVL